VSDTRQCANPECTKPFVPHVHNAIYCSDDCRKLITNQKVLNKYYEKKEEKERIRTEKRVCSIGGCGTILSIYNDESICEAHKTARLIDRLDGWGWDKDQLEEDWSF
jgi:ribosomal protein S27AE